MNIFKHTQTLLGIALLFSTGCTLNARRTLRKQSPSSIVSEALNTEGDMTPSKKPSALPPNEPQHSDATTADQTVSIKYNDSDLVDFINAMAALKGINIVLPLGANAIKEKLTLSMDQQLTVDEAWRLLHSVLSMADYKLVQQENFYVVLKSSAKETIKTAVKHLYVNTDAECLPDTDELIRYIYHLKHVQLSEGKSEIEGVLKELLPTDRTIFKTDLKSNSLLIAAPSRLIQATLNVIKALDVSGFEEVAEFIPLHHATASGVASILNALRQTPGGDDMGYRPEPRKKGDTGYFSKHVRIVPYEPLNSLLVVGRPQDVGRIKEFIQNSIDVILESGKSVIHTYELQYLKAEELEKVLEQVVKSARTGGTEQSKAGAKKGPDVLFDEVVIRADRPANPEKDQPGGSNTLIIVCREKDWRHIEALIQELDTPQPQVLLEVLIADLSIDDVRLLGGMTRNPAKIPLPGGVNFQSASLNPGVITDDVAGTAKTIGIIEDPKAVADLLGNSPAPGHSSSPSSPGVVRTEAQGGAGTTISINDADGKTWSILHLLKVFSHTKILSHPHLVALDNQPATFELGEYRRVAGEVVNADNTSSFRKEPGIDAKTVVKITPRIGRTIIAGKDPIIEPVVNLKVEIDIDEFKESGTANNTRIRRKVHTTTNVQDNAILALGGLVKTDSDQSSKKTPILGDIPILGWFFKERKSTARKSCLTIFIRPTIIDPKKRGRMNQATQDYISVARHHAGEAALFDTLRDPITHWFFKREDANKQIDKFIAKDERKTDTWALPDERNTTHKSKTKPDWNALKDQLQHEHNPLAQGTESKDEGAAAA